MDPAIVSAAAIALRASVPEIAKVMSRWIGQSAGQSVKLEIVDEDGSKVANLTPANAEVILKTVEAQPVVGGQTNLAGDQIVVRGSGNTIVSRSTVNSAFNKVKAAHSEEVAKVLLDVAAAINKSGNKEAAEFFELFSDELAKPEPKRALLKTFWQETLAALPTLKELPGVVANLNVQDDRGTDVLLKGVTVLGPTSHTPETSPVTDRPNPEALGVSLVQQTLTRMYDRLLDELPRARSRALLVKRVKLSGSLIALGSNVSVLGALGLGNTTASILAAAIALLVSGLKTIEDYLIAGVTGKEPHRLQEVVTESTRLSYEVGEILNTFRLLNSACAPPKQYPLKDANRMAKDLLRILPAMEVAQNS